MGAAPGKSILFIVSGDVQRERRKTCIFVPILECKYPPLGFAVNTAAPNEL